jgi:nitrite reductase/ring-hydroxylating ferredoxin subunit/uncharacterized membrane protein
MGLYGLAQRLEQADGLDEAAKTGQRWLRAVLKPGPVRDLLSGTWLGHRLHPLLIAAPLGSWVSATVLDLTGGPEARKAADHLIGFGILAAVPTAASGANDWMDLLGAERRVGLVHASVNYSALALMIASWAARRRGRRATGVALSLAGDALIGMGGYLGGHLSFSKGVGVNVTAFDTGPRDWTAVATETDLREGEPIAVEAEGTRLMLVRYSDRLFALADRCTHLGGPLHEGELSDGCVTCPWHGSTFRLNDGHIQRGPASQPQPVYDLRVIAGKVEVRRVMP